MDIIQRELVLKEYNPIISVILLKAENRDSNRNVRVFRSITPESLYSIETARNIISDIMSGKPRLVQIYRNKMMEILVNGFILEYDLQTTLNIGMYSQSLNKELMEILRGN